MGRTRRVTLREAAGELGISKDAVRKRINRGTLESDVGEDGRRYVYLDADSDAGDDAGEDVVQPGQNSDAGSDHRDARISELKDEVAAWREESRRKDAILAQLARANEEQARTIRALEAPRETQNQAENAEPRSDEGTGADETERGTGRRSWWRRWWGG